MNDIEYNRKMMAQLKLKEVLGDDAVVETTPQVARRSIARGLMKGAAYGAIIGGGLLALLTHAINSSMNESMDVIELTDTED